MASDLDNMLKNIERWSDRKIAAAVLAVDDVAEVLKGRAQELCPVSPTDPKHPYYTGTSGSLQGSISKTDARVAGNEIRAEVGSNTIYAAAVHERTDVNHRYPGAPNPQAQAKYLEAPLLELKNTAMPSIAEAIRNA